MIDPKLIIPAQAEIALRKAWQALPEVKNPTKYTEGRYVPPRNKLLWDGIHRLLSEHGEMTSAQIAEALGEGLRRVSLAMRNARRRGRVERVSNARPIVWSLPKREAAE
ncbi:MAG: hypothetical protein CML68_13580 [Rhodobacteraceae bacterium]|nr:hypothetical protein [Paracoccaceae bacterium]